MGEYPPVLLEYPSCASLDMAARAPLPVRFRGGLRMKVYGRAAGMLSAVTCEFMRRSTRSDFRCSPGGVPCAISFPDNIADLKPDQVGEEELFCCVLGES
jgi:hypothetical protein